MVTLLNEVTELSMWLRHLPKKRGVFYTLPTRDCTLRRLGGLFLLDQVMSLDRSPSLSSDPWRSGAKGSSRKERSPAAYTHQCE